MRPSHRLPHRAARFATAAAFALAAFTEARPARGHGDFGGPASVFLLADLVFIGYDLVAVANEDHQTGWLIAQTVLTTPQAVLFDAAPFLADDLPGFVFVGILTSQLSTFGIYGLADTEISTDALYGLSWAIGSNAATTAHAVGSALNSQFVPPLLAWTQIITSVPQIAVATYALTTPSAIDNQRTAVLATGAWSSALLVHGALSLFLYSEKRKGRGARRAPAFTVSPTVFASRNGMTPGLVATFAGRH